MTKDTAFMCAEGNNAEAAQRIKAKLRELPQRPEPDILTYAWNDENLKRYLNELKQSTLRANDRPWEPGCKLFYINPVGSLRQNEDLIGLVTNYMMHNVKEEVLLRQIFSHGHPIFRTNCMAEVRPGTGEFRPIRYDLVEEIIKRKDSSLLKKLYDHINLSDYADYAEEIDFLLSERTDPN